MMEMITPFKDRIRHIKSLLQKVATSQDTTQRGNYARQINEYRSQAETILLKFQTKHKDEITTKETDTLWAPLDYTAFNTFKTS